LPFAVRYHAGIISPASDAELLPVQQDVERLCPVLLVLTQPLQVVGTLHRHTFVAD
jgi:hypothetical protein